MTAAINENEKQPSFYNNRGNINFCLKRFSDAINDFNKAIQLDENQAQFYTNRGNARYELNKFNDALADYEKAVELDKNCIYAYYNLGVHFFNQGNNNSYKTALDQFNTAAKCKGSNSCYELFYMRGECRYLVQDIKGAIEDYSQSISIN